MLEIFPPEPRVIQAEALARIATVLERLLQLIEEEVAEDRAGR